MRSWIGVLIFWICIGASSCLHAQPGKTSIRRPLQVFAPEDANRGFEKATAPSDLVLDALLQAQELKETEELANYDRESLRKLFVVTEVNLGKSGEEDYIALGSGLLSGADNHWFWIVPIVGGKGRVILFTNGLEVTVLPTEVHGHCDVKEVWGGNLGIRTRLYRFNGSSYELDSDHVAKVKP